MRRLLVGVAILSLVATSPLAWAGDREIAQQIIQTLKQQRDAGRLKGFTLDLKVDDGVVLLRGEVSDVAQRTTVLDATKGIEGVRKVVDQIAMKDAPETSEPAASEAPSEPQGDASPTQPESTFSLRKALQTMAPAANQPTAAAGPVMPVSATETAEAPATGPSDDALRAAIVEQLNAAKRDGTLRGFGVDLSVQNGTARVEGRVANAAQKALLVQLIRRVPGVQGVEEEVAIRGASAPLRDARRSQAGEIQPVSAPSPSESGVAPRMLQPVAVQDVHGRGTANVQPAAGQTAPVQAAQVPYRPGVPGAAAAHPAGYGAAAGHPVGHGGAAAGMPASAYPAAMGAAAPRYEQPYMPNYAWPGYAAYPNYAAVTYPQQYSPTAWPYIGPFYPYPQVPLGWRRVSLEWDDGWWYLDFTDRDSTFGRHFGRH